jgi:hypothetical protein
MYIIGIVCYNQEAKDKLAEFGFKEEKIKIMPDAYY